MKTAMQEAIEYLKSFNLEASAIILEEKFIEKEKKQIINAWIATDNELQRLAAEEYYNQTYNQNK